MSGSTVVLTYDEALDPASTPPTASYQNTYDGTNYETVRGVKVAGQTVTLTLATAAAGRDVEVSYTESTVAGVKNLADYAGNKVAEFPVGAEKTATNIASDTAAPQLTGAEVSGSTLTLSYGENEKLDRLSVPGAAAFTVAVAGSAVDLAASNPVSVGETAVTLTLAEPVFAGETVTLGYTAPTVNPIRDLALRNAGNLSGRSVVNNTVVATAPPLTRAVVAGRDADAELRQDAGPVLGAGGGRVSRCG